MTEPAIDVVVPTWNSRSWLPDCLAALARQSLAPSRVIVVDSASDDGTPELAAAAAEVVRLASNRGFAAAANAGWRSATSEWVALLNPDTRPAEDWLRRLADAAARAPSDVAAIASLMLRMDDPDLIDDAGDELTRYGAAVKRARDRPAREAPAAGEVFSACAGAALYRRRALDAIAGFDETFETYLEDVDLGFRLRLAGWRAVFEPAARVLHQGGASGVPRARYVSLVTRNRLLLLSGCLPAAVLGRDLLPLLWGQLYFALAYRRPMASLRGLLGFLAAWRAARRRRRSILTQPKLSARAVRELLRRDLGEPPLRSLVARRLGR